jgi:hypothetical protein
MSFGFREPKQDCQKRLFFRGIVVGITLGTIIKNKNDGLHQNAGFKKCILGCFQQGFIATRDLKTCFGTNVLFGFCPFKLVV